MQQGQQIAGSYTVDVLIGQGGMGAVYRGQDLRSGQPVAIKVLKPEIVAANPDMLTRFEREAEILRQLNHPNIVKVLGTFQENGQRLIVMEYVGGGDLSAVLKRETPLPLSRILTVAIELADALTRAHYLKVIHRDLKPANVLIADDGAPRLTDFGVAYVQTKERLTTDGTLVGTLDYMSPEALSGGSVDARADIWAFGVILFEMLAGQRPFTGETLAQTVTHILTQPPGDLEGLRPDAPVALVDLIYRMLEKDRSARLPSVRLVGAELEAIMQGKDWEQSSAGKARAQSRSEHPGAFTTPTPAADTPSHNLPAQTTPFVGREQELEQLGMLLAHPDVRLVTILSPGGMGKTRLALAAAERVLNALPPNAHEQSTLLLSNAVYFVALAPLTPPDFLVPTIAEAVGLQFSPGGEPKQQLLHFLRHRPMLLVMDNFEHLLEGATLVSDILDYAPNVKILTTSRERLNLAGETLFALGGMDFPDWETPADALDYAAVKLFVQSARRARPGFELKAGELTYLARICRLVAGMPLAIVLAAAWVEMLSLKEIAAEIEQSLDFLETERRDIPERQRSIYGVFDHAWRRLSEDERGVFMRLSVFRGGFTREAAQPVAGATLKTLAGLVNKSLLSRDPSGRFGVHELVRQYAEQELNRLPQEREQVQTRHAAYYAAFMDERWNPIRSSRMKAVIEEIEPEIDNVRVAWNVMVEQALLPQIAMTARVLWIFLDMRGQITEGISLFGRAVGKLQALPAGETRDNLLGETLAYLGHYHASNGSPDQGKLLAEEGLGLLQGHDDAEIITRAYISLCLAEFLLGEYQAMKRHVEQGMTVVQEITDPWYKVIPRYYLGLAELLVGEYEEAYHAGREALLYAEQTENPFLQGICCALVLGRIASGMGNYEEARRYYLRGINRFESIHHRFYIALSYGDLSGVYTLMKDYDAARLAYQESMSYFAKAGPLVFLVTNLRYVSTWFEMQGEYVRAVELLALLLHHPAALPTDVQSAEAALANLRGNLSPEDFEAAYERGKALDLDAVVAELLQIT